jgi:hypothetical protein
MVDARLYAANLIAFQFCPQCGSAFRDYPHAPTKSISATSTLFAVRGVRSHRQPLQWTPSANAMGGAKLHEN